MRVKTKTFLKSARLKSRQLGQAGRSHALFIALFALIFVPLLLVASQTRVYSAATAKLFNFDPTVGGTDTDAGGIEVGVKFTAALDGDVTGVRFFKTGTMGGTHTGNLWDKDGNSLATATFTGETSSGWQEVTFSSPVTLTKDTIYTASVFMADGVYAFTSAYFTSAVDSGPLTAPASGTTAAEDGFGNDGQGVFNTANSSAYPTATFNSTNYWVDVIYSYDTTPPTVTSTSPTANATDVNPGETITATFDHPMDATSISTSTFIVNDSGGSPATGTVSYDSSTRTASFVATEGFSAGETYTATLEGGSGTVVENIGDVALASDFNWSFTIAATNQCPCSLVDRVAPSGSTTFDVTGALELGVKITPQTNGYFTALRFYKPITSSETTHTGNVWDANGNLLASATFSSESDYGWQEAKLSTPLKVNKDQLYIVSYGTTTKYQATVSYFSSDVSNDYLTAYAGGSANNAASGSGNANGAFSAVVGVYPLTGSGNDSYYWVDAVFSTTSTGLQPLSVDVTQPKSNAYGVEADNPITATLNRVLDSATVTSSSVTLVDSNSTSVSGTVAYSSARREISFTPSSSLSSNETYTMTLAASVADSSGDTLGSAYSWSFTVGSALSSNITAGPGGPILVITDTSDKYSSYYAEIMRTEGLNYFDVKDISAISASTLNSYNAVVLSDVSLTQAQADMFESWVTSGGNLVAMRPDKKLASLLGITDAVSTRTGEYLLIDTSSTPGSGLVNETIQFKGTADNYTLSGASALATFYSDASTATSNPAVTYRSVGNAGGTAAAFTYDLAKSVIAQHQGNQAWAGDNRDGSAPVRPNDMFFGAKTGDVQDDWVNLDKIHIPQADEQQRLLANILIEATRDLRPLPRFWYLPGDHKAAVVFAGDDHGLGDDTGTEITINNWLNESTTTCSVMDWECVRASHYTYSGGALTQTRALQYHNLDFEIGNHPPNSGGGCASFSSLSDLTTKMSDSLTTWRTKYTGIPDQRSNRYHCYAWNDWDSMMVVDAANGMRYDLNYVVFPASWLGSRGPIMTGSGMNMRFTDADGDMVDVYQGVTNFDNTTAGTTSIGIVLDNAIGSAGYYGIFGTHYDMSDTYDETILSQVTSRNIPLVSSEQVLTWLDGRNSSTFSNFGGADGLFTFDVAAAEGAVGLHAMLPTKSAGGTLTSLKQGSSSVSYATQTVKGVQYAVFDALPGSYTAQYSDYDPSSSSSGGGGEDSGTSTPSRTFIAQGEEEEETTPTTTDDGQPSRQSPTITQDESDEPEGDSAAGWIIGGISLLAVAGVITFFRRGPSEVIPETNLNKE